MRKSVLLALSLSLALVVPTMAHADTIHYPATGSGGNGPLSASAAVVTSAGQLQITLTNDLATDVIKSSGQAISGISFDIINPGTLGTVTATGQQGSISTTGLVSYSSGSPGNFGVTVSPSGNLLLTTLGGGQPSEMIVPFLLNGGDFSSVNKGFQNFDPYTIGPATFTLDLAGLTANTSVSDVNFYFGTGPDTTVVGIDPPTITATPEPSSLFLLGTGLLGLVVVGRRTLTA